MPTNVKITVSAIPTRLLRKLISQARELAQVLEGEEAREVVALVVACEKWASGAGEVEVTTGDD